MNTPPTEPGYYWAKTRSYQDFEPVELDDEGNVDMIGAGYWIVAEAISEWGEKIERKRQPEDTTP